MSDKRMLGAVVTIGFALRLLPVPWGSPFTPVGLGCSYHPDEPKFYESVLGFPGNYLTNHSFIYGTACQYLLGLLVLPWRLAFGPLDTASALILSRLFVAATGTAAIWLLYKAGRLLFDARTGLLAAALLSVSCWSCLNGAVATLDVPMSALVLIDVLLCLRAIETDRTRDWSLLGVGCGLLLGTKIVGGLFFAVPLVLILTARGDGRPWRGLAICGAVAGAVFFLSTPHVFLNARQYLSVMADQKRFFFDANQGTIARVLAGWVRDTGVVVGWPVALLAVLGASWRGGLPAGIKAALLVFIGLVYLFWRGNLAPRYIIFLVPIFCLFAASTCVGLLRAKSRPALAVGWSLFFLVLAHSAYHCLGGIAMRFDDTRDEAAAYIRAAIPPESPVGLSGSSERYDWREHPWRYPRLDLKRHVERRFVARPTWLILSSYDFEPIAEALKSPKLGKGYVWDRRFDGEWYLFSPPSPRLFALYDELLNGRGREYALVKTFEPRICTPIEFPPPEIRIYRKRGLAGGLPEPGEQRIRRLFPAEIGVGGRFNVQQDGSSAIAVEGSGFEFGDRIYWNGEALDTVYGSPQVLTAVVPAAKLARAGTVQVTVGTTPAGSGPEARATFVIRPLPAPSP